MWICTYVRVVALQYRAEELVFCMPNRLDDEAIVTGEVEERPGFARRPELRKNILRGEGEEVVSGVQVKTVLAKLAEDPRSIVFKLEIVFG